jgi:hypothetical protein
VTLEEFARRGRAAQKALDQVLADQALSRNTGAARGAARAGAAKHSAAPAKPKTPKKRQA